ncbi:MAG: hypothetical protein ABFD98_11710 [Syntrophobacteraceae bacterium]
MCADFPAHAAGGTPGERCCGVSLDECKRVFGDALPRVCATCPD